MNQLTLLNKQYAQAGGAVEDYAQRAQRAADSFNKIKEAYDEQISAIDNTENSAIIAAAQLETLSSKAVITNSDLDIMSRYADYLNDTFNCNIKVNYDIKELTNFNPDQVMDIIKQKAEANRVNVAAENYFSSDKQNEYISDYQNMMNAYYKYQAMGEEIKNGEYKTPGTVFERLLNDTFFDDAFGANYQHAVSEYNEQKAKYENLKGTYDQFKAEMELWGNTAGFGDYNKYYLNYLEQTATPDLPPMIQAHNLIDEALEGNVQGAMSKVVETAMGITPTIKAQNIIDEALEGNVEDAMSKVVETLVGKQEEITNALTPKEVADTAYIKYEEEINKLAETYAEACASIKNTLNNMFGIFEEAKMNLEETLSLDGATENLQSQLDYFNQYKEAIEQLEGFKVDSGVITQLSPEQAVAFANELSELNKVDMSGAKAKVQELNDTFNELTTVKDDISNNLGGLEIELPEKMAKIKEDVEKEIAEMSNSMNFTDDAVKAANETMSGYLSEITSVGALAVSEAQSIATQIKDALNINANFNYSANGNSDEISRGYATGTLSAAPGLALVGENGPELINFGGGEVVYTADETRRIFDSYSSPFNSGNLNSVELPLAPYLASTPDFNIPENINVNITPIVTKQPEIDIPESVNVDIIPVVSEQPEIQTPGNIMLDVIPVVNDFPKIEQPDDIILDVIPVVDDFPKIQQPDNLELSVIPVVNDMPEIELPETVELPFNLYQASEPEIDIPEGVEVPVSVYQQNSLDLDIPQSAEIPVYTYAANALDLDIPQNAEIPVYSNAANTPDFNIPESAEIPVYTYQANEPEFDIPYSMEIPLNVYQANEAEYNLRQRQNDNSASNLVNEYQSEKVNVYIPRGIDELIEINKQLTTAITTRNTTDNTIVNVSIPKIDLDISRQFERFSGAKATDYYTEDLPKEDNDKRSISDDDFKYLKDLAEREVINRVYAPEIKIEMVNHNNVNSDVDIDDMVDKMVRGFEEAVEVSTEGVHV